jgi:hypothetical protein
VWAIVTAQVAFYVLGLILRPYDLTFLLVTSADRLILQLSPALVLLFGLALRATRSPEPGQTYAPEMRQ